MSDEELQRLEVPVTELTVGGEQLEVRPLTVGQLPAFMRAIRGIELLWTAAELDVAALVADHGEALIEAAAIATVRPAEWVRGLGLDEFMQLVAAVLEINADFFVRRVLPGLTGVLERLTTVMAGVTSSPP